MGVVKIVRYLDIKKAIVIKLKTRFPNIESISENITERIIRPSFYVTFDNMSAKDFMASGLDRDMTVRIRYFSTAKNDNEIENLNMQDDLSDLFIQDGTIEVTDDVTIEIDEAEISIVDKVLHFYFDIHISEDYDRPDNTPLMEDIEIEH